MLLEFYPGTIMYFSVTLFYSLVMFGGRCSRPDRRVPTLAYGRPSMNINESMAMIIDSHNRWRLADSTQFGSHTPAAFFIEKRNLCVHTCLQYRSPFHFILFLNTWWDNFDWYFNKFLIKTYILVHEKLNEFTSEIWILITTFWNLTLIIWFSFIKK